MYFYCLTTNYFNNVTKLVHIFLVYFCVLSISASPASLDMGFRVPSQKNDMSKNKTNFSGKSAQTSGKTFLPDVHHTYFFSIFCKNIYSNNKYIQMSHDIF